METMTDYLLETTFDLIGNSLLMSLLLQYDLPVASVNQRRDMKTCPFDKSFGSIIGMLVILIGLIVWLITQIMAL